MMIQNILNCMGWKQFLLRSHDATR